MKINYQRYSKFFLLDTIQLFALNSIVSAASTFFANKRHENYSSLILAEDSLKSIFSVAVYSIVRRLQNKLHAEVPVAKIIDREIYPAPIVGAFEGAFLMIFLLISAKETNDLSVVNNSSQFFLRGAAGIAIVLLQHHMSNHFIEEVQSDHAVFEKYIQSPIENNSLTNYLIPSMWLLCSAFFAVWLNHTQPFESTSAATKLICSLGFITSFVFTYLQNQSNSNQLECYFLPRLAAGARSS